MKIKLIVSGLLLLLFMFPGCRKKSEPDRFFDYKYRKVLKQARQEAMFFQSRNFIPGGSIALSIDGKLAWSEGFGQVSSDLGVPAGRNSRYRMGQISQVLTSIAYYQLVETGKLSPEDNLTKHLPEFPVKKYSVRLKNLVSQTSGIRQPNEAELYYRDWHLGFREAAQNVFPDTLLFEPGVYQYPTYFAFNLLGTVVENAAGRDFQRIIKSITDTLQMTSVVADNPMITIKGRSDYFDRNIIAQVVHATPQDIRYRLPSEGYLSTVEDLVKLGDALLSSPVLSDSVKAMMLRPPVENPDFRFRWGNGLMFLTLIDGSPVIVSRGLTKGGGSILVILPEEKIVLGWLSNLNDETEEMPGIHIASMFRDFLKGTFGKVEKKQIQAEP